MVMPPGGDDGDPSRIRDILAQIPPSELRATFETAVRNTPARGGVRNSVGVAPGRTVLTLPDGRTVALSEWLHQIHEVRIAWGGCYQEVVPNGAEQILYTLSVAPLPAQEVGLDAWQEGRCVPGLLQETRDLGKIQISINARPMFSPPVRYLLNHSIQLHEIEKHFRPRALFEAATALCDLLAQAPKTIENRDQLAVVSQQLEIAQTCVHGVGEAYAQLVRDVHGGTLALPLTVRDHQVLEFRHLAPAGEHFFDEITVEYVALQKRAVL